ncbi:hypothetical protein BOX15_Mlig018975g2 [Macrostomum lignano]|uniref:Telomere length regulation protein conserved domain-containing protein n=1 Tax=Macrostomum lignano TaxID=282301 RepID=A0A267FHS4_9PLAT|nr:hypothetical protein BOX15_Mlig018975g1 [Macrostomum lignano]PAA79927.1 hypothetical protein BOX15_Mlig018975g2 [Macrostomum lignano]
MDPLFRRVLDSSSPAGPLSELESLLADPAVRPTLLSHAGGSLLQAIVDSLACPEAAGRLSGLSDAADRLVDVLPPAVSLAALLSRWRACRSGRPLAAVIRLTIRYLTGDRPAEFLLGGGGGADPAEDEAVSRWLANLSTVVSNRLATVAVSMEPAPDLLTEPSLSRLLCHRLVDCLARRADAGRCARLAGLLCLNSRQAEFWTAVENGSLAEGAVANLLSKADPAHLENLLTWPIANCTNFNSLCHYFGRNLVAKEAATARLLLTDKLLFVRRFDRSLSARNIARYLHWADWSLFCRALLEAGRIWSQPVVVRSNGIEQHRHITWFLVVGARLLSADDTNSSEVKSARDQLVAILVPGIAAHFEHNADNFRWIGMATGEVVTDLLRLSSVGGGSDDERRLKFDQPACPDSNLIKRLAYGDLDFVDDIDKPVDKALLGTPDDSKNLLSGTPGGTKNPLPGTPDGTKNPLPGTPDGSKNPLPGRLEDSKNPLLGDSSDKKQASLAPIEPLDSDDDESDDDSDEKLRPIQASLATDGPAPDANRPRYIRQLLDGLRATAPEERDQLRASLIAARQLIAEHPGAVRELSLDLASALLNLNSDSDDAIVEGFAEKRMAALTELVCSDPGSVAPYLASQVFLPEYCTSQRLDALLALQTAALSLSRAKSPPVNAVASPPMPTVGRVTRRWGRPVHQQESSVSAFSQFAGEFFFGLARGFDTQARHLDLIGPDYPVLCRLLYTLGVVYFCAENSPGQARMLSALAELLPVVVRHPEAPVRRGALFCYACLGLATPHALTQELLTVASSSEAGNFFNSVDNEPDAECRQLAACAGSLLAGRLSEAWRSAINSALESDD